MTGHQPYSRGRRSGQRGKRLRDIGDKTWTPWSKQTGVDGPDSVDKAIDAAIKEIT